MVFIFTSRTLLRTNAMGLIRFAAFVDNLLIILCIRPLFPVPMVLTLFSAMDFTPSNNLPLIFPASFFIVLASCEPKSSPLPEEIPEIILTAADPTVATALKEPAAVIFTFDLMPLIALF